MKRIYLFFFFVCLFQAILGQKKYEMVIDKTDNTSVIIKTEDIIRTYFREINHGTQSDFNLIGTWCYGSSEEDALGDLNNIEGYVFRTDGSCTYFAIYNNGTGKEMKKGTYTYEDGVLVTSMTTAYEWKNNQWEMRSSYSGKTKRYSVYISGNCMTWTGDDNEMLWTREGFTVDLGENNNGGDNNPYTNVSAEQVFGKWICYYQKWTQDGETSDKSYNTNEYYIELNSDYTGTIHSGRDELFEVTSKGSGKSFVWSLSNGRITAVLSDTRNEIWTITSLEETELTLQWEDREANYAIIGKFKKDDNGGSNPGSDKSNDPEGTVTMECRPNTWLVLFEEEPYSIYCDKNIFETHNAYIDMVDIGEVSGLADITSIPMSGWVKQTAQNVGHGYVFRYLNASTNTFTYARVYIENISPNSLASIIYIIKYQVPFVLENSDVIPNGTYGELDGDENNNFSFIVNGSYISWTHYINHQIEWYSNVEGSILTGIDYIYTIKGDKINLSSFKGAETLNYSRNGREVTIGSRTYVKLEQIVENR